MNYSENDSGSKWMEEVVTFTCVKITVAMVTSLLHRGYYMAARRYEISLRVLKNIFQNEKRYFVSSCGLVIFI